MRIFDLALNDLTQIFRDRKVLLFLVAMPIAFTLFMGFAYQGSPNPAPAAARLRLGWDNQDPHGALAQQLYAQLASSASLQLVETSPAAAEAALRSGSLAGVLRVPAGYSDPAQPKQLTLLAPAADGAGAALFQLLRVEVTRLMSALEIAQLSAASLGRPSDPQELAQAFDAAARAWAAAPGTAPVQLEKVSAQPKPAWYGSNPYNQSSPGVLVMFAIFGLVSSGQILVQERKLHTLQRMVTTSLPAWQIILGHLLAMFAVVFLQEALLIVFGQLALGVDYAREALAVLLVALALGLWIAALGLLIGVWVKDDSQVVLVSLLAMFVFSALGGTWFPLEGTSGLFAALGQALPSAWAMTGFQNILIRGQGLASAWLPAGILLGYALLIFAAAVWRFKQLWR